MTTILLSDQPDARYVQAYPTRTHDRLRARLCARQLDDALAGGAPPDASVALSLHARRLIGPKLRRALARELRALIRRTAQPRHRIDPCVPICRQGVLQAAGLLVELSDRLEGAGPVEARGVAQLRALLRNGESPLFDPNGADEFVGSLQTTLDVLERCIAV